MKFVCKGTNDGTHPWCGYEKTSSRIADCNSEEQNFLAYNEEWCPACNAVSLQLFGRKLSVVRKHLPIPYKELPECSGNGISKI